LGKTFVERVSHFALNAGAVGKFPLRLLVFWLLFFALFRIWFIGWLHIEWSNESPWPALWKALPLDLSMAGYLMALPLLLWFAGMAMGRQAQGICNRLITGFNVLVFAVFVFTFGANVFLYQEWHTLLNNRALEYFRTPAALLDSMSFGFKSGSVAAYLFFTWIFWLIYRRLVGVELFSEKIKTWNIAWLPVHTSLLFLAIRGGLGVMPINESAVYYSPHLFYNHAATNTAWHVIHSLIESRSTQNHYRYMDDALARKQADALFLRNDTLPEKHDWLLLPAAQRPNVVFILMESMTAQVVEELGGEPGVCPNLSRLIREGLLFDRCYSSGFRTDQGLVAVLGGFPAQPDQSIVLLQDKAAKLPSVPKMLKETGYATSFFYGGELTFANIGVWLRNQQFEKIISENDFSAAEITQRWGADDGLVFQKAIATLNETQQPFFSTILTLSLHTPYDVPYQSKWTGAGEREMFLNSAAFADHAIGQFFQQASRESWYANTLFVLVADHGHINPGGVRMDDPRSRQVPLIITGPLIHPDWQGKRIHTLGNHHDIPATILEELGYATAPFSWSKDLLRKNARDFAYYTNENGLGWVSPQGAGFFQFESKQWQHFTGALDSVDCVDAKAYLQTLYNDYLGM